MNSVERLRYMALEADNDALYAENADLKRTNLYLTVLLVGTILFLGGLIVVLII